MSTQYEVSLSDTRLTDEELVDALIRQASRVISLSFSKWVGERQLSEERRYLDALRTDLLDRLAAYREAAP